jgi:uncharacterized protein YndB with AHSA1/START domain
MRNDNPPQTLLAPVIKTINVRLPIEAAFRLFTERTSTWWPLATHSVGGESVVDCRLEGQVGGRFYEIQADGMQAEWGQVLAWEPPRRLVFTLHPGRTPEFASLVEVTFQSEGNGCCLTLTHTNWEACGENAAAERLGYERGWESILKRFQAQAAPPAP